MSVKMSPEKTVSLTIENADIDPNRWNRDHKKYDNLAYLFLLLNGFAGIGLALIASLAVPDASEWLSVILVFGFFSVPFIVAWKAEDRFIDRLKNDYRIRTESYRREKAGLIIDALNNAGFTVDENNGPNYLAWGDRPEVFDKDGNKYNTRNLYITGNEIAIYLDLADRSEESLKNTAETLVEDYEKEHGSLSDREKEIFIHAVQVGGKNAIESLERY